MITAVADATMHACRLIQGTFTPLWHINIQGVEEYLTLSTGKVNPDALIICTITFHKE